MWILYVICVYSLYLIILTIDEQYVKNVLYIVYLPLSKFYEIQLLSNLLYYKTAIQPFVFKITNARYYLLLFQLSHNYWNVNKLPHFTDYGLIQDSACPRLCRIHSLLSMVPIIYIKLIISICFLLSHNRFKSCLM